MFNISRTNEQITKPFFFLLKTVNFECRTNFVRFLGGWDICKTKRGSEIDKYIFILTWSGPHNTKVALRCPEWLLTGLVIPLEAFRGPKLPQLVFQGVSRPLRGQSQHLKATLVQWGPLQVSMNMYFSEPESHFVFQISRPSKIAQNWFCIQNLHMDLSFQKKEARIIEHELHRLYLETQSFYWFSYWLHHLWLHMWLYHFWLRIWLHHLLLYIWLHYFYLWLYILSQHLWLHIMNVFIISFPVWAGIDFNSSPNRKWNYEKGAVKYCLVRRTTADFAFLLASTNVHTESQPIGMQNQLLSFSLDNT